MWCACRTSVCVCRTSMCGVHIGLVCVCLGLVCMHVGLMCGCACSARDSVCVQVALPSSDSTYDT